MTKRVLIIGEGEDLEGIKAEAKTIDDGNIVTSTEMGEKW